MSIDWQPWAIALLTAAAALLGWLLRELWSAITQLREDHDGAISELRRDHGTLRETLADKYARRDDVRDMFAQVMDRINSVFEEIKSVRDKLP